MPIDPSNLHGQGPLGTLPAVDGSCHWLYFTLQNVGLRSSALALDNSKKLKRKIMPIFNCTQCYSEKVLKSFRYALFFSPLGSILPTDNQIFFYWITVGKLLNVLIWSTQSERGSSRAQLLLIHSSGHGEAHTAFKSTAQLPCSTESHIKATALS